MKFRLPVEYTMIGEVEVEANTVEEAYNLALQMSLSDVAQKEYLSDSFQVNRERYWVQEDGVFYPRFTSDYDVSD